jgi:hypothetical protein
MSKTKTKITSSSTATETAPKPLITPREQAAIKKSLAAGLVPEIGLEHLVVGRKNETQALVGDLDIIKDGGASFRLLVGLNGAGKTFMQRLLLGRAIRDGMVVLRADLGVNHRLYDAQGRARALYSSLMANVYTKASPSGHGLRSLLESWMSGLAFESGSAAPAPEAMSEKISLLLRPLKDFPGGFEFAAVLARYYEGHDNDNPALQDAALRWLKAEYSIRTEAKENLGVRRIIGDEDIYNALKLFAAFCKLAGYNGLLVILDELSALTHRLSLARMRQANVQVLLTIINEVFQGGVSGLGFLLAGTPETLTDPDRGLFSIPALRSRLQTVAPKGYIDLASPVLRLEPLGQEELHVLLLNVCRVHALGNEANYRLPDEALSKFLDRALVRFGRTAVANPRDVLRPFVTILNLLEQQPEEPWEKLMDRLLADVPANGGPREENLAKLKLG